MFWLIIAFIFVALVFQLMARKWGSSKQRPAMKRKPMVSFVIASYNKHDHIEETIKSAKACDYPNKEIIVVNDSDDSTPEICRNHGVICIQNPKRLGKPKSLNMAVERAKGEIIFFLDADTVIRKDALSKAIPWFGDNGIGAVMPLYSVKNHKRSIWTRLAALDTYFISNLLKTHMFFGSLSIMRGCSVAVRKDALKNVGMFRETLVEDVDLAVRLVKAGYKIQYEPEAIALTGEPETLRGVSRQRFRWGKGALHAFLNHRKFYLHNRQFHTYFMPYAFLILAVAGLFLFQTAAILPFMLYAVSTKEALLLLALFTVFITQTLSSTAPTLTMASLAHVSLLTYTGRDKAKDLTLVIPYMFIYMPVVMFSYLKGIISGIRDRRKGRPELVLKDWED